MSGRRDFRHSTPQRLPSRSCADAETGGHLESRTDAGDLFSLLRGAGLVYQHDACRLSAVVRAALHHLPQREPKYRAAKPSPHLLYDAKPNALRPGMERCLAIAYQMLIVAPKDSLCFVLKGEPKLAKAVWHGVKGFWKLC